MFERSKDRLAKPHLWLIAFIGVIVPRRLRADWRQEWEAELQYRETLLAQWDKLDWGAKLALLWHSAGAFADALWIQPRRLEDEMFQDLRFGVRMLLKSPAFTLAAILSLAIGIGANTALFSVVNAVLWRPLPYPGADRLVRVGGWPLAEVFAALKQTQRAFDGLAGWNARDYMLTGRGGPAHLKGQCITAELLPLLGVTPRAGRAFVAEEFQPGRDQVALISHRLWQSRFGADPQIIGQAVTLDQQRYTVVGVTPPRFDFFPTADLLTPLALTAKHIRNSTDYHLNIVARLKPGLTLEQARQEMSRIAPGFKERRNALIQELGQQSPGPDMFPFDEQRELRLQPLRELLVKDFRLSLLVLWGVVGFVLLIACSNVANLMLARAANRQKELAIRAAVGARRARLARQLLTESVLVAGVGGALGLLCAYLGEQALLKANPAILPQLSGAAAMGAIPRLGEVAINGWVTVFNFGLTLLTGALFGEPPVEKGKEPVTNFRVVTPGYFGAIGMPLKRGRDFNAQDNEKAAGVVIVDEAFARRRFPNQEPIGRRITLVDKPDKPLEIVGVVGDVKNKLDEIAEPYIYIAYPQFSFSGMGIVIRTGAEPTAITPALRGEVMALDPALPISGLKTVEQIVFDRSTPKRIMTAMMGVFAVFALLMAGAGLYAVMAYAVSRRTHEIGVRLALGARPRDILRMITRQGMKLTLAGLVFGLAGAFALTRVISGLLFGVSAADPLTFILISLLLTCVALLACYLPARRATKVDPMIALRHE